MLERILKEIKKCIQCGICSGSCPLNFAMDIPVRKLINLLKAGYKDEVLKSQTFWLCSSCYFCYARCPQGIDLAEVMYELHRMSLEEGIYPKNKLNLTTYRSFMWVVEKFGRNFEPLMFFFLLSRFPQKVFDFIPLGIFFLRRKKIAFTPSGIKNPRNLMRLLNQVQKI